MGTSLIFLALAACGKSLPPPPFVAPIKYVDRIEVRWRPLPTCQVYKVSTNRLDPEHVDWSSLSNAAMVPVDELHGLLDERDELAEQAEMLENCYRRIGGGIEIVPRPFDDPDED